MDNSFSGKGKAWEWGHSIWIFMGQPIEFCVNNNPSEIVK